MAVIKKYSPGEFCWTDLGTTDPARAKKFYQTIFGWKVKDFPMGGDAKYSMFRVRGKDACALYPMAGEQRKAKAPPSWLPYICVKSVDATVQKAKAARGMICMGPLDVMDKGRMATLQDPTGATFAIWQERTHRGAGLGEMPGTVFWHDLNTPKPKAAGTFYTKVFGWKLAGEDVDGNAYYVFNQGKGAVCGMWPSPMKKLPASWVTYWQVANCAKTVAKLKRLGGRVLMGTTVIPGMGHRFAIVTDPQRAVFGIFERKGKRQLLA